MVARSSFVFALLLVLCACDLPDDSQHIGRFSVHGNRTESCGDTGLLASPAQQDFKVHLRRVSENVIQWSELGDAMSLQLAPDGLTFEGSRSYDYDMRAGIIDGDLLPECLMRRVDTIAGTMSEDERSFVGTERHDFVIIDGSDCSDLLAPPEPIATSMPCAIAYDVTGEFSP